MGRAPCSYSSGSRTSRKVTPPPSSSACASAWSTSRMDALASFSRSRGVGTFEPPGRTSPFVRLASKGKTLPAGSTFPGASGGPGQPRWPGPGGGKLPAMELHEAIRRRAMVRSFSRRARRARTLVDRIVGDALRSPTAGNTRGTAWVRAGGAGADRRLLRRHRSTPRGAGPAPAGTGLRRAPVVLLAYASADAYVERYGEPDKAGSGLGRRGRAMARALLDRGCRLRRDGGPARCGRRRPGRLHPGRRSGARPSWRTGSGSPGNGASSARWRWAGPTGGTTARRRSTGPARPTADRIHRGGWGGHAPHPRGRPIGMRECPAPIRPPCRMTAVDRGRRPCAA